MDIGVLPSEDIKVDIDICCIDFLFDRSWFMHRIDYCVTKLDYEIRARQTRRDAAARVLVRWHNPELFASRSQDRAIIYVGVDSFDRSSCWSRRLLDFPTPPVLTFYSSLVARPNGVQQHLILVISLM